MKKKEKENKIVTFTTKHGNEITIYDLEKGYCSECKKDIKVKTVDMEYDKRNIAVMFICNHIKTIDIHSIIEELIWNYRRNMNDTGVINND